MRLKNWRRWTRQKSMLEGSTQKKHQRHKRETIFPNCRWYSKIVGKGPWTQRLRSKTGTKRKERSVQWKTSRRIGRVSTYRKTDDAEARADFWSIQGDFIHRHHNEPRVQLNVPTEETFTIPLKYIDVTRSTLTNLDVLQENRRDDCWNVDANGSLSESWTGFTKITLLKEKPPKGFMWSGERLTKVQTTTRLENVLPGVWTKIGKAAQNREKQEGKTRSQNSTMLDDWEEFTSLILMIKITKKHSKIARIKWERPMAAAVLCKRKAQNWHHENGCIAGNCISKESTRQRVESSVPTKHEEHIAGKGCTSMSHYNLVHTFIPLPQAIKIPDAKVAVDKEW